MCNDNSTGVFYASPSYYAERKIQRFGDAELFSNGGGSLFPHSILNSRILDGGTESACCLGIADATVVVVQESCRTLRSRGSTKDSRPAYLSDSQCRQFPFGD